MKNLLRYHFSHRTSMEILALLVIVTSLLALFLYALSLDMGVHEVSAISKTPPPQIAVLEPTRALDEDEKKAEKLLENTPMAGLGSLIVKKSKEKGVNWRIVIGIAEAESNRGKAYVHRYDTNCSNAWGIKPPGGRRADGSYLRCYDSWEAGVDTITGLLSRRYKDQTPEQMCGIYVVPCNPNWLATVNKFVHAKD